MNDNNIRKKNSIELIMESCYGSPNNDCVIKENVPLTGGRSADINILLESLTASKSQLDRAGKELNQLPTDISSRLFEKYSRISMHLERLIDEVTSIVSR